MKQSFHHHIGIENSTAQTPPQLDALLAEALALGEGVMPAEARVAAHG